MVLGAASLAYFVMILVYNGITALLWIWPCFAVMNFLLLLLLRRLRRRHRKRQPVCLRPYVFCFTSFGLGILCMAALLLTIFTHAHSTEAENLDYLIVMGTDLDHNRVSASLKKRLDLALEYAQDNPRTVLVLSGGKGDHDTSTEATVMYYYMVEHGIPAGRLLMEFYSDSTLEKIGYSLRTIAEDMEQGQELPQTLPPGAEAVLVHGENRPLRIGILTSEINVYRATAMARHFGLQEPAALTVRTDELLLPHLAVREALAIFKDRLMGNC